MSGELRAGEVLYLPRGWWHPRRARTRNRCTCRWASSSRRDALPKWLTARMALAVFVLSKSLPLPKRSRRECRRVARASRGRKLFKLWTRELLAEFRNERAMKGFARPRIDLKLNEGQRDRHDAMTNVRLARTRWVVSKPTDDGEIAITVGNTTLRTTPAVGEILGRLKNTSTIPVSALMDDAMRRDCAGALQTALDTLRLSDQVEFLQ